VSEPESAELAPAAAGEGELTETRLEPNPIQLRGELPRVMRLSRNTLAIAGAAGGTAIGAALFWALQPAVPNAKENLLSASEGSKAEVVTGGPADYGMAALHAPHPGDLGGSTLEAGEMVPPPAAGEALQVDPRAAAIEQQRTRMAHEGEAARSSGLFLAGARGNAVHSEAASAEDLTAGGAGLVAADKRDPLLRGQTGTTENPARLTAPSSPYVVQAGSVIPAALITGIQSDLPGQVTAQVTQNVFDSATGRVLLIPQGSRLIGAYDSKIVAGQDRVLLAWDRLILPGGRSIDLMRQPGADASGMAGLADRTDHHWGHMLKAALISTVLGVGAELGSDDDDRLVRALRDGSQDTIGETGRQLVSRQIAIPPTITVQPGFIFRVIVTRDLVLEPIAGGLI
jgi:type IV secretion system protein VirB10